MTIRVPVTVLIIAAAALGFSAISFGIALAVTEWRQSDYIDCVARVENRYLDQWEPHRAARPEYTGSSDAAYRQYSQQFDKWQDAGDAISRDWIKGMRACD